jgi:hypothetical protein
MRLWRRLLLPGTQLATDSLRLLRWLGFSQTNLKDLGVAGLIVVEDIGAGDVEQVLELTLAVFREESVGRVGEVRV